MEIAMPPSDMMLTVIPIRWSGMKARRTETGIVRIGTSALGTCQRKIRMTIETMTISSISFPFRLSIADSMSVERS